MLGRTLVDLDAGPSDGEIHKYVPVLYLTTAARPQGDTTD